MMIFLVFYLILVLMFINGIGKETNYELHLS